MNNPKKRNLSTIEQLQSHDSKNESTTGCDTKRLRQDNSSIDQLKIIVQRAVHESSHESTSRKPSTIDKDKLPDLTTSSTLSNLWERKCMILQEELRLRKQEQECLKIQLEQERQRRKLHEIEVKQKIVKIQELTNEIDGNKAAKTAALEEQLKEEQKLRKQHEHIIQNQRLQIQNLCATPKPTNESDDAAKLTIQRPICDCNDANTDSSTKEQLINARRKQLELIRVVEGWKQKAMELRSKLHAIHQSHSRERRLQVAERRRMQTAEQLLKIGKTIPLDEHHQQQSQLNQLSPQPQITIVAPHSNKAKVQQCDKYVKINTNNDGRTKDKNSGSRDYFICHAIATAPNSALKFDGKRWIESENDKYPSRRCRHAGCTKRVRTFCRCSPGYWRCPTHVAQHIAEDGS